MKELLLHTTVQCFNTDELSADDLQLIEKAKAMTFSSYSPYSHFQVGAALRLADGQIFGGSNQENASYPVGLCAERTAFFYASSAAPDVPPVAIAIAAQTGGAFLPKSAAPCGMCRQALLEAETRFRQPIRVLLYGTEGVMVIQSVSDLLPLNFDGSDLPSTNS